MEAIVNFITNNYDTIIAIGTALGSLIWAIVVSYRSKKKASASLTEDERKDLVNKIKGNVMGFITVAENLFVDIPKAGSCKLLYVLNQVKALCKASDLDYDEKFWEDYVDGIVSKTNEVLTVEGEKANVIDKIKEEIPYIMNEADTLFDKIPNNAEYKIAYILNFIKIACGKYPVNVYDQYDWKNYVTTLYKQKGVA